MDNEFMKYWLTRTRHCLALVLLAVLAVVTLRGLAAAQDQDDPPSRAARLGYMEGSVSFQPAGENEWVQAVPNRPMTIGDKIWADRDSRAEVQLGSATMRIAANTGFSFLNLDDRTVQIQLSAGSLNLRVHHLDRDDVFEVDTPNQAFSLLRAGSYRVEASEDGNYTVVTVREGEGESTGNGQTYTIHSGQRVTLSGTNSLNADMEQIGEPDDFDRWASTRDRRYDDSPSGRYVSHDMVGYQDLDDHGDWRPSGEYGNVWYPRVGPDWAPYHEGHWAWVDPWGWTWVDDEPWGYAPFHYGRWSFIEGRWGWIPGPIAVAPVYAPALVVFVGGGPGFGGNVAWFPLGPREVFVPSYHVSEAYVNRVNVSNTTVSQTTITNVYNTTIVNNNTTITNVNYVNRNARGAVTAVPQAAFASAQPVAKAAVRVTPQQLASASVNRSAAVAPTRNGVMGAHANTAGHVAAPPQAVASRQVVAKAAPPPPPPSFAARQQALAAHPGQPIPRQELAKLRPVSAPQAQPQVKVAPPGKPATPVAARPGNQPNRPGNPPAPNEKPGANAQPNQPQPGNRPGTPPAANERPGANAQPNRPQPNQPQPGNRPGTPPAANERPGANAQPNRPQPNQPQPGNRPESQPPARNDRPSAAQPNRPEPNRPEPNQPAPGSRPEANRPEPNRPAQPPAGNERPPAAQPNNRPEPNRPEAARPEPNQPQPPNRPQPNNRPQPGNQPESRPPAPDNRPPANRPAEPPARNNPPPAAQPNRPEQNRPEPARPQPPASDRPQPRTPPPAETRPAPQQEQHPPAKPQTPEEKRKEQQKRDDRPQPPG